MNRKGKGGNPSSKSNTGTVPDHRRSFKRTSCQMSAGHQENSADGKDEQNIGISEQDKDKVKTDKEGSDHHDHGKPKEKPQNEEVFHQENSADGKDEQNIGISEQDKDKVKTDKEGSDHHDHGKPKEKPQNEEVFHQENSADGQDEQNIGISEQDKHKVKTDKEGSDHHDHGKRKEKPQNEEVFHQENSADGQDEQNIGISEQDKDKVKTDKEGSDHHDHGKPKEKPQNEEVFHQKNSADEQDKIKVIKDKDGTDHHDYGKPKEKPQNQDVFLYIWVVILAVGMTCVILVVTYIIWSRLSDFESRLSDYDRKFSEMNKSVKYLEMLKSLQTEVPEIKEKISTIQDHVIEANNRFQPLWTKLSETQDKLDLSEYKTKMVEIEIKKFESDIVQMKTDLERLSGQSKHLSIQMDELIPQLKSAESNLSTLHQKMAETEERVLPSLERQKELIDTVDELSIKVNDTTLSVYGANETLSNITYQMERNQPMFDYVKTTFIQAQEIKKSIGNMQQHASRTERSILNLHGSMRRTESRFSELSSNVTTVEHRFAVVDDKHTQLVSRQKKLYDNMDESKNDIINLDHQLTKTKGEVEDFKEKLASTQEDMTGRLGKISVDIDKAGSEMSVIKTESEGYNNRIDDLENHTKERIEELNVRTENEERFTTYVTNTLPRVVATLETIKGSGYSTWIISVIDLLEIAAITYLFYVLFNRKYQDGYSQLSAGIQSTHHVSHTGTSSSVQRPSSILDQIHRKPAFANKICILSFYAETQPLHKSLVTSAVELSRRGKTMQIIPHLVRRHEDILDIPSARYIFIFVDFNERNVILEKPDQDLGDKKMVTVKAAQKLGGDVFVTYVRDKGSANLFPGHLFNINLSAFTTHPVLKPLEINQRCFSVYERYTNTQKEHIASVIV